MAYEISTARGINREIDERIRTQKDKLTSIKNAAQQVVDNLAAMTNDPRFQTHNTEVVTEATNNPDHNGWQAEHDSYLSMKTEFQSLQQKATTIRDGINSQWP